MRNEDRINPKTIVLPNARQVSLERVMGIMPKIVQMEVMNMASILDFPASTTDSKKGISLLILRLILSMRMIAFLTTMPKRARIPMRPGKLNVI